MPDKSQTECSGHTPEPWQLFEMEFSQFHNDYDILTKDGETIATACGDQNSRAGADAARIIACVNACAGIPSEDLARGVVPMSEAMAAINAVGAMVNEKGEAV